MKSIKVTILLILGLFLMGCNEGQDSKTIHFSTSAEYPPFEYIENDELKGFDIDLAKLIAKELGKEAVFDNMQFSTVLPAVSTGQDEAAIATITVTEDRKKNFDFTQPYYFESMAAVYPSGQPITKAAELTGKKIGVQLGSVMEIWVRSHFPANNLTAFDNNNQAIEALTANHVDVVIMDSVQAIVFSKKHSNLSYAEIAKSNSGYAIATKKDSLITKEINEALLKLESKGEIKKLISKWLQVSS